MDMKCACRCMPVEGDLFAILKAFKNFFSHRQSYMPAVSTVGYSKIACFLKKCEINYLVHTMTNSFLYNDVELLQRIQLNDEKALACLMRKYYTKYYPRPDRKWQMHCLYKFPHIPLRRYCC